MTARILSVKLDAGLPVLFVSAGLTVPNEVEFEAEGVAKEGLVDRIEKDAVAWDVACVVLDGSVPPVSLFCVDVSCALAPAAAAICENEPVIGPGMRDRTASTRFIIPTIPSTSMSVSTIREVSSESSEPYPAIFILRNVRTCTPRPLL